MTTVTLDLPAMYGDHHVVEVRRILFAIPGVTDVYASSAFHAAEVTFDPAQTSAEAIEHALGEAGYLDDLLVPVESDVPVTQEPGKDVTVFRHTAAVHAAGNIVTFGHKVPYSGRPLWPCPGMGPLKIVVEGE